MIMQYDNIRPHITNTTQHTEEGKLTGPVTFELLPILHFG